MGRNGKNLPGVGEIAGREDIAPEGTVITEQHVLEHRAAVEQAHRNMGLPTDNLWPDS